MNLIECNNTKLRPLADDAGIMEFFLLPLSHCIADKMAYSAIQSFYIHNIGSNI